MRWEIINNKPKNNDTRVLTKFAWFPTRVMSKLTHTDHIIWLEMYLEEQLYTKVFPYDRDPYLDWKTVSKTIYK